VQPRCHAPLRTSCGDARPREPLRDEADQLGDRVEVIRTGLPCAELDESIEQSIPSTRL
jgi:hypothetical protein